MTTQPDEVRENIVLLVKKHVTGLKGVSREVFPVSVRSSIWPVQSHTKELTELVNEFSDLIHQERIAAQREVLEKILNNPNLIVATDDNYPTWKEYRIPAKYIDQAITNLKGKE